MERARTNASGLTVELCRDTPFGMNLICTSPTDQSPIHFASLQYDPEAGKKSVTSEEGPVASRGPSERRGFGVWGCSPLATAHSLLPLNGRWLSPDWSAAPVPVPYADLADPQRLNLYAYVRGNPVSRNDPDGHACYTLGGCLGEKTNGIFTSAKKLFGIEPPPPPAQGQQMETVVFSDRANATPDQPEGTGTTADRTVDYRGGGMDKSGHINTRDIDRGATLTLHEKLDPNSKTKSVHIADKPKSETGVLKDYQFVITGGAYRVLRDWKVGSDSVRVLDTQTRKAFGYEVTTFDTNANPPIKTEYANTPPF